MGCNVSFCTGGSSGILRWDWMGGHMDDLAWWCGRDGGV